VNIVVLASGSLRYGLIVDHLLDSEEIVVKPLGAHVARSHEYAGATILGDGAVALILDVAGISTSAGLTAAKAAIDAAEVRRAVRTSHDAQTYLVVENGKDEHFAIPLGLVSRIERVPTAAIVDFGGRRTINHGSSILALVGIEEVASVKPRVEAPYFFAIICRVGGREVGVLASRVVDIIDGTTAIDPATHLQPGILGSTILDGRLMLLVDIFGLVDARLPEYRRRSPNGSPVRGSSTVLVVEDSPFFRKQLVTCLSEEGWTTLSAENGEEGLSVLGEHADEVGLILTDIEMPRMDGLEMTRRIRADARHAHVPILACTSVSGEVAERRGREAGLTEYLIKLDREQVVERTTHYLKRTRDAGPEGSRALFTGANR
jgi:two-component system chemotaxis sensor kinase CheA